MKHVYFVSNLIMLCTLGVADAEALGKRNRSEVPEDRAANVGADDDSVPVDLGWGPRPGPLAKSFREFDAAALAPGADSHIKGVFGDPFTWPIIPIHATLLPNGKVYSFGTSTTGAQGAALWHDLWDPELGTHTLLHKTTPTDSFCAAQAVFPNSGQLLIAGGDTTVSGNRNYGAADTNVFDYKTGKVTSVKAMAYKRWYPTLVARANGEMLVLGGRQARDPSVHASTPEVYTSGQVWRKLTTATNGTRVRKFLWFLVLPACVSSSQRPDFHTRASWRNVLLEPDRNRIDQSSDQRKHPCAEFVC